MSKTDRIRLSDVAALAGVSRAAVGKVLNGGSPRICVSSKTHERILEAAKKLNYRPNMAASILAGGDSRLIGIIVDSHASYYTIRLHQEIERLCSEQGYRLISILVHDNIANMREDYLRLQGYGVNKFICCAHDYPQYQNEIIELFSGVRDVVFMGKPPVPDMPYVQTSQTKALSAMIKDALQKGYRRIGMFTGYLYWQSEQLLYREFEEAMRQNGLEPDLRLTAQYKEELSLQEQIDHVMKTVIDPYRPDFLFLHDAAHAASLQFRLMERGIRIGICGGNNNPLFGGLGLSSLDPCYERIAQSLLDLLIKKSDQEKMFLVEAEYKGAIYPEKLPAKK